MPWYLYLALKQLFPTGRFFSFFAFISSVGVMLGVAVLFGVQSVMNGFGAEINEKLVKTFGHVRVDSGRINYEADALVEKLEAIPEATAVNKFAEGMVLLQYGNRPTFPVIRGIDVNAEEQVIPVDDFTLHADLEDLDDETIFIGTGVAMQLDIAVGDTVEVYSPLLLDRLKQDEVMLPRELEVAGLFETGYAKIDSNTVVVTLRLMQELYGLGEGVHGVMLNLDDENKAEEIAAQLNEELEEPFRAMTWLDANQDMLFILQFEKGMMTLIMVFIILVASFSIVSSLLTSVLRKTREIGLLGAMGGSPKHMGLMFAFQGFLIGCVGSVLGICLSMVILYFRDDIIGTFTRITGSEAIMIKFYQFARFPVQYQLSDMFTVVGIAIFISTLAGLLPAWRAARLKPSDALRNE
ncbi:ABC transporter permease [Rubellicoccus peritrichatus]|uniref:ABC transporter permease n=1 Tax=Rubellicoccus peritrichatus TaxID=3080537 RepID=A0AAQ3QWG9_9BACT|nr:ABC transporter permease [Puniceicoccus sp. CR14]WOO41865.1 ABC transporter permease [Puniceicoccus sp. CR14]